MTARLLARTGLLRTPWLTASVFAITAATSLAQLAAPELLDDLERRPSGLHGDWWRTGSSLFVQDGGVFGAISNLVFLAVIGGAAEQVLSRPRWLAQYFGVGLLAELVGYAWQPVGGGNSIAICGLAGALAVGGWRHDDQLPAYTPQALLIWSGALLATLSGTLAAPMIILGVVAAGLARRRQEQHLPVLRLAAYAVGVAAIVLAGATNIHGAALLIGIVLALLTWTTTPRNRPERGRQ